MLSYGLPLLGAARARGAGRWRGSWRPLPVAAVGALAVVLAFAAFGFSLVGGATRCCATATGHGVARRPARRRTGCGATSRPSRSAPARSLGAGLGHAAAARATCRATPRRARWLGGSRAARDRAAADASQMSKAEVERIWLPFVPWLLLGLRAAARALAAPRCSRCRSSSRCSSQHLLSHGLVSAGQARSGAVANAGQALRRATSARKPSSPRGPLGRGHDVPDVAEPVAAGDHRSRGAAGAAADERGHLEDRDRPPGAHVVAPRHPAPLAATAATSAARWRGRRRRRARSRASGRRPRRPAAARRARARSGTSPRPRSTACPAACRGP